LNGFWSEKQQYSAAHQPDLRQILLVPVIKTFYIWRKKNNQINNQTVQMLISFGQRVVLVIIPSRNTF